MRAFVKREEFFWKRLYSPLKEVAEALHRAVDVRSVRLQRAQIFEGQWVHDGNGIRPAATGFDRVITLGDMNWTDYEVTAKMTFNSFDTSQPVVGSAVGLALGWQGHSEWGQPRFGHPSGGLCLYSYNANDPLLFRLQLGYSPGPAHDTIVAGRTTTSRWAFSSRCASASATSATAMTRYSCKMWQAASRSRAPGHSRRTSRTGQARPARTAARSSSSRTMPTRRSATSPSRPSRRSPPPRSPFDGRLAMRIAFVTQPGHAVVPASGSIELWADVVARRLAERHDVTIYASRPPAPVAPPRQRCRIPLVPHGPRSVGRARAPARVAPAPRRRGRSSPRPSPIRVLARLALDIRREPRCRSRLQLLAGAARPQAAHARRSSCCTCIASGCRSSTDA